MKQVILTCRILVGSGCAHFKYEAGVITCRKN